MNIIPYINASYPILYIRTLEQERAYDGILAALQKEGLLDLNTYIWRPTTGLQAQIPSGGWKDVAKEMLESLRYTILQSRDTETLRDNLYFFFNARSYLQVSPQPTHAQCAFIQQLRDCAFRLRTLRSCIIFIGSDCTMPSELQDVVTVLDFNLPDKKEIKDIFKTQLQYNKDMLKKKPTDDEIELAADASIGLTAYKAENAIALSIVEKSGLDMELLQHEKELAVRQSEVIDFIRDLEQMDDVGGFNNVKNHVSQRAVYFSKKAQAQEFGCSPPKGIMLVGIAGTGKSLIAKAIAKYMGLHLYVFNVGAVFKSLVGESESSVRYALRLLSTLSPCVVLFDEFEKMLAGTQSSGRTDSGVTSRVIATILTWMQECKDPIYKVATCNTITNLDAALFRRGRWDAVFGVDLPSTKEREDIFKIHLEKRKRKAEDFNLTKLAAASDTFVGAEIESAVEESLYGAFYDNEKLTTERLVQVCQTIKPIASTEKENIESFRRWLAERAQPASSPEKKAEVETGRGVRRPTPQQLPLRVKTGKRDN